MQVASALFDAPLEAKLHCESSTDTSLIRHSPFYVNEAFIVSFKVAKVYIVANP